ncbi:hypothetical protein CJJ23_01425 [Mycoplasmopsis agassizii]|uniref:Peptidase S8/S53 domain-containing protein n=1 Tax=Mycoplasmopsis agassizii TaxID=33922 RepID=A0A269TJC9_9BACT|nr:S8 family serine peptidase [Mycoplasmopsis agassizii]PAK21592.1 hypothetical protein CJJ23_01425 [Mycoplasmopsis agassizii]
MNKSLKRKIFKSLFAILPLTIAIFTPLTISANVNEKDSTVVNLQQETYNVKSTKEKYIDLILSSGSISEIIEKTTFNYVKPEFVSTISNERDFYKILVQGANRIDIVFKAKTEKTKLKSYLEMIRSSLGDEFENIYGEYTLTFSIAYKSTEDFKKLLIKMLDFKLDYNDILQVNVHETGRNYDYFNDVEESSKSTAVNNSNIGTSVSSNTLINYNDNFWNNYTEINKRRYTLSGFDYQNLKYEREQAENNVNKYGREMKVGILEVQSDDYKTSALVDSRSASFFKNSKIHLSGTLYNDPHRISHANTVAEIIMGKQGINPSISLYSSQFHFLNGLLNGALNWYLRNGVHIVNNSWKYTWNKDEDYNTHSEWLDNFLNANEDFIFIIGAGNDADDFNGDDPSHWYGFIDAYNISQNAITVGALKSLEKNVPTDYTEASKNQGYITTSVPGEFQPTGYDGSKTGTSFAAPTITGMASLLKTNYPSFFDRGSDYLIIKSALISGSRKDDYTFSFFTNGQGMWPVYDIKTGFGRANFFKVRESLLHLNYLKVYADSNKSAAISSHYFEKNEKYRVNATWKGENLFKNTWVQDFLFFGHNHYTYIGPLDLKLQVITPDGDELDALEIKELFTNKKKLMNTETIEFETKKAGYYKFKVFYDPSEEQGRKKDLDVALTYSKI